MNKYIGDEMKPLTFLTKQYFDLAGTIGGRELAKLPSETAQIAGWSIIAASNIAAAYMQLTGTYKLARSAGKGKFESRFMAIATTGLRLGRNGIGLYASHKNWLPLDQEGLTEKIVDGQRKILGLVAMTVEATRYVVKVGYEGTAKAINYKRKESNQSTIINP